MRAKTILNVCNWLGPPYDGGNINRYEIMRRLSQSYECQFVVVRDSDDKRDMTLQSLKGLGIEAAGLKLLTLPKRTVSAYVRGLLASRYPAGIYVRNTLLGAALRSTVEECCSGRAPDALIVWGPGWASTLQHAAKEVRKRILYACDSMSMVLESLARGHRNPLRRVYYKCSASRYRWIERDVYPAYDEVLFVSQRDADHSPCLSNKRVICNGVDTNTFMYKPELRTPFPTIGFHGNLSYVANAEVVIRLNDQIAPALQRAHPNLQTRIVGGPADAVERLRKRCSHPALIFTGYVDNLTDELNRLWVYVGPLTMGGGVKNKILEALACGCPVVGTAEAFSGLALTDEVIVACPNDTRLLVKRVSELLNDEHARQRMGHRAREWATTTAGWDAVCARFRTLIDS
jgi:polysaccharide biosynthesis protein PslH